MDYTSIPSSITLVSVVDFEVRITSSIIIPPRGTLLVPIQYLSDHLREKTWLAIQSAIAADLVEDHSRVGSMSVDVDVHVDFETKPALVVESVETVELDADGQRLAAEAFAALNSHKAT